MKRSEHLDTSTLTSIGSKLLFTRGETKSSDTGTMETWYRCISSLLVRHFVVILTYSVPLNGFMNATIAEQVIHTFEEPRISLETTTILSTPDDSMMPFVQPQHAVSLKESYWSYKEMSPSTLESF